MKAVIISLFGAGALLLTTGCQSTGAYTPVNTNVYDKENTESVVLMDKHVQRSVTLGGPIQETTLPDGRLEIAVNLRNREARRIQVQVSCVFKDGQGFSTGDETPWKNVILTELAQETVRVQSMNDKAQRYTVRVRQAR